MKLNLTKSCYPCEHAQDKANLVGQTTHWRVFLVDDQTYPGRCVVVLKRHAGSLTELTAAEWKDFHWTVKKMEFSAIKGLGATLSNWNCLMNSAYQEKPYNPHVHWHFRPRYDHQVKIGTEEFTDQEFGKHYERGKNRKVSDNVMKIICSRLKKAWKNYDA